jgi:two-component system response regulator GlrR
MLVKELPCEPRVRRRSDVIIGASPAIARVLELVSVAAASDINVMILGESGTGKELVARAIHYTGRRATHPFIAINCGAIPETLMEDELFGHARGAYTDAHRDKKGVFEEADGGTLFFDEIGELYLSSQVKLLRALEERETRRLGETQTRRSDVRIICATNKDLEQEMGRQRFRQDLFHRISVMPIQLPPLRERLEDLPLLVDHFVRESNQELGRSINGLTPRAHALLQNYSWPGNVRELDNRLKQAMVMARGDWIDADELAPFQTTTIDTDMPAFRSAKATFEKDYVARALRRTRGNVAAAARLAAKDRKDFYDLMKRHDIDPDDFRRQLRPA